MALTVWSLTRHVSLVSSIQFDGKYHYFSLIQRMNYEDILISIV
jgi:hypothetical protein